MRLFDKIISQNKSRIRVGVEYGSFDVFCGSAEQLDLQYSVPNNLSLEKTSSDVLSVDQILAEYCENLIRLEKHMLKTLE